jgi:transcription elongation GreA/GreB family factor
MSRAFVKEGDGEPPPLPERAISPHPNLVTARGLRQIEARVRELEAERTRALATARAAAGTHDAAALAGLERDLRYWRARKASARPVTVATVPEVMRFGVTATLRAADGATRTLTIVGEDEADPARGLVSWVSPAAESLIGAGIGEDVAIGGQPYEIIELAAPGAG